MRPLDWTLTGGVWPMGVSTSLTWYDIGAILHIISEARGQLFVEIGVEHGGLAALLLCYGAYTGMAYRGIDITLNALHPSMRERGIIARDAWDARTVDFVSSWMRAMPGPVIIFCDGGNKPRELSLYAPLIRPGDVLIGHDYHNEYGEEAIDSMPPNIARLRADWLDRTLLCVWEGV